jgi:hypothetical protein
VRATAQDSASARKRCHKVVASRCGTTGANFERVSLSRIGLDRSCARPQGSGVRMLPAALLQVGLITERSRVVRGYRKEKAELVARILYAPETLLENGRATKADGAKRLQLAGISAQPLSSDRKVRRQIAVAVVGHDPRLDGFVGLFVGGVEREHLAPDAFGGVAIVSIRVGSRETLEHGDPAFGVHTLCDLSERQDAGGGIFGALRHALERAPASQRLRIELAGFEQRPHRSCSVAASLSSLGDLHPALGSHFRGFSNGVGA